jgi:hypothetical protein
VVLPAGLAKSLDPGRRFAERGAVSRFVASTETWKLDAEDPRVWQPALDLARAIAREAEYPRWPPPHAPRAFDDTAWFQKAFEPRFVVMRDLYRVPNKDKLGQQTPCYSQAVIAPEVISEPFGLCNSIVVARGAVKAVGAINTCIVLANGNVTAGRYCSDAIVVSDGDVEIGTRGAVNCLVVARGDITVRDFTQSSILVAGGKIRIEKPKAAPNGSESIIREHERRPFRFVRFFELLDLGVQVEAVEKRVRVTNVPLATPAAAAGVREGDVITHVGRVAVDSSEGLRRLVRDASATKGEGILTVRRDDTTTDIRVPIPD